jgi:hypothetical protein
MPSFTRIPFTIPKSQPARDTSYTDSDNGNGRHQIPYPYYGRSRIVGAHLGRTYAQIYQDASDAL